MAQICVGFKRGELSHNEDALRHQIAVEGGKRIVAFIFEAIFRRNLNELATKNPDLTFSFGWHVAFDGMGKPAAWFRLIQPSDPWNRCDRQISMQLLGTARVIVVRTGKAGFEGAEVRSAEPSAFVPLRTLLDVRSGVARVRDFRNRDAEAPDAFWKWAKKERLALDLAGLSIQRRFMNCFLKPVYGRQGSDLDAMVSTSDNRVYWLEFKRKYPAIGKRHLGLDIDPHCKVMGILSDVGIGMFNILLISPIWKKQKSIIQPLAWLDDATLIDKWCWVIREVSPECFADRGMRTLGTDSGYDPNTRDQMALAWPVHLMQEAINPKPEWYSSMRAVLEGRITTLAPLDFDGLRRITDGRPAVRNIMRSQRNCMASSRPSG